MKDEDGKPRILRVRAYVVGNRMYQTIADYKNVEENNQMVQDFFNSLKIFYDGPQINNGLNF